MSAPAGAAALLASCAAGAADQAYIAEVIVTAQKRAEDVQNVPAAVSVFGSENLERIRATQLTDYAAYMPGINVSTGGSPGQTSVTLRGVAPVGPGSVVGTYIDDTPLGSSANFARATIFALDLMPYDVQRVEVLRGPQGTLYGAGSMGGLLKYVLRDPDLGASNVRLGVEGSSVHGAGDPGWGVRAAANVPLSSSVAFRASYGSQQTPGYVDNVVTGEQDENEVRQDGGRAVLLWRPVENLSVKLAGTWQSVQSHDNTAMSLTLTGVEPPTGIPGYGDLKTAHALSQPFEKNVDYYSATLNWDLGWASFVSASSYSDTHTSQIADATEVYGALYPLFTGGAVPAGLNRFSLQLDLEKWTQELRLTSSSGGSLEWLAGLFYTQEESRNVQRSTAADFGGQPIDVFSPYFVFAELPTKYRELAGFGDVTVRFDERFDITAGLRWAKNKQNFRQISGGAILPTADAPGESSEDVTTWMLTPRMRMSEDAMLYARVATGFRPGGPNTVLPGVPEQVDADKLINYEIGLKAQFLERRALVNVAAFRIDWSDIQQAVPFSAGVTALDNAGDAESKGVELESAFHPVAQLQLGFNLAYTQATLKSNPPGVDNRLGVQLPGVPEWSGALSAGYDFTLGGWDAHVGGGYRYVGEQQTAIVRDSTNISYVLPSYRLIDLNAEVKFERLTVRLFAKNLTDERAYGGANPVIDGLASAIAGVEVPVRIDAHLLQPRTIGVSMDYEF